MSVGHYDYELKSGTVLEDFVFATFKECEAKIVKFNRAPLSERNGRSAFCVHTLSQTDEH